VLPSIQPRERFTTLGKQAKAFGAGVKAATEFERVKGDFLGLSRTSYRANEQKGIALDVSQYKRQANRAKSFTTRKVWMKRLEQAEVSAELAR
jgi:hypothetical protein